MAGSFSEQGEHLFLSDGSTSAHLAVRPERNGIFFYFADPSRTRQSEAPRVTITHEHLGEFGRWLIAGAGGLSEDEATARLEPPQPTPDDTEIQVFNRMQGSRLVLAGHVLLQPNGDVEISWPDAGADAHGGCFHLDASAAGRLGTWASHASLRT